MLKIKVEVDKNRINNCVNKSKRMSTILLDGVFITSRNLIDGGKLIARELKKELKS